MRSPSRACSTISAFSRGRRKRINTEGTEASAQSTQRRAEPPVPAPAIANRFATSYALLLASTVFLGAFLLFLIEPLFAKLILPRFSESYRTSSDPASTILLLLSVSIGLPFVLLSATSPLIQIWYARASAQREPYHLFALSNLASLLALLSYPLLIEPHMAAHRQATVWSVLFVVFALLCSAAAWLARAGTVSAGTAETERSEIDKAPKLRERLLWLCFSACSSMLLLSITNKLLEDV